MASSHNPPLWQLHGISAALIATVIIAHTALLAVLFWVPDQSVKRIELPAITGMLIPAPPAEQVQAPAAAASSAQETQEAEKTQTEPEPVPAPQPDSAAKPEPKPQSEIEPPLSKESLPEPKPETEPAPEPPAIAERQSEPNKENPSETAPNQTVTTDTAVESQATPNEQLGAPITPPNADAAHLNNPAPAYPRLSRRLREQGVVLLEVLIMPNGSVGDIRIQQSSGYSRLDETALEAVQQWRYEPARRGSEAIAYWYLQPVDFSLD